MTEMTLNCREIEAPETKTLFVVDVDTVVLDGLPNLGPLDNAEVERLISAYINANIDDLDLWLEEGKELERLVKVQEGEKE